MTRRFVVVISISVLCIATVYAEDSFQHFPSRAYETTRDTTPEESELISFVKLKASEKTGTDLFFVYPAYLIVRAI